jgi:hypothetical protein
MSVTTEHVFNVMRKKELVFFRVKEGGSVIDENNEAIGVDEACDRLQEVFSEIDGNFCEVVLSSHDKETKSAKAGKFIKEDMKFRVRLNAESSRGGSIAGDLKSEMQKNYELNLKIKELEFDRKLDLMKRNMDDRFDKLEEESEDGLSGIIKPHAGVLIPALVQALTGKQVPLANPGLAGTGEEATEDELIERDINRLMEVHTKIAVDFSKTLHRLANFAERDNNQYKQLLAFIP